MSLINNLLIKSLTFIIKESYGKTKKKKKKIGCTEWFVSSMVA